MKLSLILTQAAVHYTENILYRDHQIHLHPFLQPHDPTNKLMPVPTLNGSPQHELHKRHYQTPIFPLRNIHQINIPRHLLQPYPKLSFIKPLQYFPQNSKIDQFQSPILNTIHNLIISKAIWGDFLHEFR